MLGKGVKSFIRLTRRAMLYYSNTTNKAMKPKRQ